MTVSVIVPTYDRGYIICDALRSALDQTYRDVEIVVVDDGSRDNTREIIDTLHSDKIRYIRHDRNRGCSAAYNTGINQAKGSLIAFLDSDDVWKRDYLERQVSFLFRHPKVGVVFCDTEIEQNAQSTASLMSYMRVLPRLVREKAVSEEYVFDPREMYLCLLEEMPIKPTAAVIRREMFYRGGVFDEAWPSGTDCDLFIRLSRLAPFGYIDGVFVVQRRTQDATHQRFREKDKLFLIGLFLKEKASVLGDRQAIRCVNRGIGAHYNSLAWHYLEAGQTTRAFGAYWDGFKETLQPRLLRKIGSAALRVALMRSAKIQQAGS
jgi:glycosyltransferase involved in cell wall biosynthesis